MSITTVESEHKYGTVRYFPFIYDNTFIIQQIMEEIKLSDDVFEQINHLYLTEEEELFIDKLIINDELKKRYKEHGLCKECKQPNTGFDYNYFYSWCQSCNAKCFQQNFKNWTSGNNDVDEFIQNAQIKAINYEEVLEWIEYDRFENVEFLAMGGFGTVYKAFWKDGYIEEWDSENDQWKRVGNSKVVLKCLHNSQDTAEFLREIEPHLTTNNLSDVARCYGITKDPVINCFMMVIEYNTFKKYYIKHDICKECKQPNVGFLWCQSCNAQHFQQDFKNWTSGSHDIDEFIQNVQLKSRNYWNVLEWIEYDKFENVEYLAESEHEDVYKAIWKDGYIYCWDSGNNQWVRYKKYYKKGQPVALKWLHDSQNITIELLKEIESHLTKSGSHCYGITKHPEANNFMMVFNIEEIKLSDNVFEQIKYFDHKDLTEKQKLLIDNLILNEELKNRYKKHGLCEGCKQPNTGFDYDYFYSWCQPCNAKRFQQNFKNWTSGNNDVDEFIQNAQTKAINYKKVLEWIEYERFENVEFLANGGFGTVYKTIWKDGYIKYWDSENDQWKRYEYYYRKGQSVVLKWLHSSQNTVELLKEIESHLIMNDSSDVVCYGITKVPETNSFMMVIEYDAFKKYYITYGVCEKCKQPNTGGKCYGYWCQSCNAKRFQQNFKNWTSGNNDVDEFIQNAQIKARNYWNALEWIEFNRFENVEYLAKGGFGIVYETIWKDGYIESWDSQNDQWKREGEYRKVALKCLNNSQDITIEFLGEIEKHLIMNDATNVVCCYGITKDPETNSFMMVIEYGAFKKYYLKHGVCKECKQPNIGGFLWCQSCNANRFQQNFQNWTSGSNDIDEFIQNVQLKSRNYWNVLEWIEYDKFENVEYLAESEHEDVYKAIWKDGYIYCWDSESNQWERYKEYYKKGQPVTLKCLHDSQIITIKLLKEIESYLTKSGSHCYGITKHPESNNFMMVFNMEEIKLSDDIFEQIKDFDHKRLKEKQILLIDKLILNEELKNRYKKYGLCEECNQPKTDYYWCHSCNAKRFQQNFKNWTSGNNDVDEFIQNAQIKARNYWNVLEWIEYNRFKNVVYLAKGGFGIVYETIWNDGYIKSWDSQNDQWKREFEYRKVALKCLSNSQDITIEFLGEIEKHLIMNYAANVVCCYGITKDPETNNFMMVMQYANNGSLRQNLNNQFNLLCLNSKIEILFNITNGLEAIHDKGLIHHDFHCGNILSPSDCGIAITDLGLCRPANVKPFQSGDIKIYGVLPYVAPEVLKGKEYTQASDIYAFGIIAYEVCTGLPPYHDVAHEEFLAISICKGLRPKSDYAIPQLILDIIEQCWDANPLKRPNANELRDLLNKLRKDPLIYKQIEEANKINKQVSSTEASSSNIGNLLYTTNPQAIYTSRLLDFKNLPEPKNADNVNNSLEAEYSESMAIDFTKLNSKGLSKKRKIDE